MKKNIIIFIFMIFVNNSWAKLILPEDTMKIKIGNTINVIVFGDNEEIKNNTGIIFEELEKLFKQIDSSNDYTAVEDTVEDIFEIIDYDFSQNNENEMPEQYFDNPEDDHNYWEKYKKRFQKENFYNSNKFVRYHFFFELGFCNYLENGFFPNDNNKQYAASPLGSATINFGGSLQLRFAKIFSMNLEYGFGWNNYRFQDKATVLTKTDQLEFSQRVIENSNNFEFKKSRLSVPYLNFSIIPMFYISKIDYSSTSFKKDFVLRIGIGVFGGYRIGANMKYQFTVDNIKYNYKERKDFYINSYHYGIKAMFGFGKILDIFASYDLNPLFVKGKAAKLNTICLGARLNI